MKMKCIFLAVLSLMVLPMLAQKATTPIQAADTATVDEDAQYAVELVKKGTVAPDFTMKTIDGKTFRLSQLKGKVVVLDFWASWCPDCRKDAPHVVSMYQKYRQKGVQFVGISMDTDAEKWKNGVKALGIEYTQVSELKKFHDTAISKAYGVHWIPSLVVIGRDGKVLLSTVMSDKVERILSTIAQ